MTQSRKIGKDTDKPAGNRGKGRPKGAVNKTTKAAKEAIADAFEHMGGIAGLVAWADKDDDTRKVFYSQIWPKIVPLQLNGAGEDGEHLHELTVKFVKANGG